MRPEPELRAALATLERVAGHMRPGTPEHSVIAGEVAALRYALGNEVTAVPLADLLAKWRKVFADADATPAPSGN
jgi:hypothetical protein